VPFGTKVIPYGSQVVDGQNVGRLNERTKNEIPHLLSEQDDKKSFTKETFELMESLVVN
jgi:hypothetical protein